MAGGRLSVALSAPTGKAAARLQEAVEGELAGLPAEDRDRVGRVEAMTLHRLLGWRPDNATRFRHDRGNRLKYDVIVVDESSMVELTMMARLLEAVRPQARLVLVGDPRQLTSVGAGAVLSDLVAGYDGDPASPVVSLTENFRSTEDIKTLAEALRSGDADDVLAALRADLRRGRVRRDRRPRRRPARRDRGARRWPCGPPRSPATPRPRCGALDEHRLLCAHREGPHGVRHWNRQVERWLGEETGQEIYAEWYLGRPMLVTTNDYALEIYNGETGAAVLRDDGRLRAWISGSGRAARLRARPARRGRDDARDDHPQEPGQPGRADHRAAARRGVAAAHPRAVLHRGDPRPEAGARGRVRGRRPGGGGHPRAARDRAPAAPGRRPRH